MPGVQVRCLLKDEEIAWHVAHHGQQLLRQQHIAVKAAVDLHARVDKAEVRPQMKTPAAATAAQDSIMPSGSQKCTVDNTVSKLCHTV